MVVIKGVDLWVSQHIHFIHEIDSLLYRLIPILSTGKYHSLK